MYSVILIPNAFVPKSSNFCKPSEWPVSRAFVLSVEGSNLRSGQVRDWNIGTCCFPGRQLHHL